MENKEIDWFDVEMKNLESNAGVSFERLPSISGKLEENKVNVVVIDASKPFEKWTDSSKQPVKVKAVIPCVFKGERCNWWLNTKNPVYKDVVHACRDAKDKASVIVKVMQTGSKENTKYIFIKE